MFQYFIGRLNRYYRNPAYALAEYFEGKLFDQSQYTGGANGTTYETSKSWNIKTGIYFDDYKKLVAQYLELQNFYMTRFAVNVYFQEVTITPHSSGIPVFGIEYDENQIVK